MVGGWGGRVPANGSGRFGTDQSLRAITGFTGHGSIALCAPSCQSRTRGLRPQAFAEDHPVPIRSLPPFRDLPAFLTFLEGKGQIHRIREPVSTVHTVTEIHRRVIEKGGPVLVFERPIRADGTISTIPLVTNLFGTVERVALGFGIGTEDLRPLGEALAELRSPSAPNSLRDLLKRLPLARAALRTRPAETSSAPVQEVVITGAEVDVTQIPVQTCWPGEPAPLITWPLVITCPPGEFEPTHANVGVYRMQVLGPDRLIMRWLAMRGGAQHFRRWQAQGRDMPVAVAIGTDPATILSAVMPLPEGISELTFAGLVRGERPRLTKAVSVPLMVPADAEIVIEGVVSATETAPEGPYGDHTGYYNSVEPFPVMRVTAITRKSKPVYLSTFTGRAPDEPSVMGAAMNEMFIPVVKRQFPEIVDVWLPPEACSYRIAVVAFKKSYPGHARRLMMALWSVLPQFTMTKLIIAVDADVKAREWSDVMWAVATRSDPSRDLLVLTDTPIDYLDFASPKAGLGGKLGIDATTKIGTETEREYGQVLGMSSDVAAVVDAIWPKLGLK
ncbi:UbiD family decarboxylase [Blastochloris sulfoviridis]|uniref:UbiD family decarboxylase n=1 Tax=Blastochloris sulfoviridis TaxID=50712 RepID=A0A5M6I3V3_9HYPH|nr:UbiD family decarboxylase [Blastochloris sulfoviridis]